MPDESPFAGMDIKVFIARDVLGNTRDMRFFDANTAKSYHSKLTDDILDDQQRSY